MTSATPTDTMQPQTTQLDKAEREHLEEVVTAMRKRAEDDLRFQVKSTYDFAADPDGAPTDEHRRKLRDAIAREQVGGRSWAQAVERYVKSAGYTLVNRLTAMRCMEVRGFIELAVTRFREDGRTPASERLIEEEFYARDEALLTAYDEACEQLGNEIELLFDPDSPQSLLTPSTETFEALCRQLDEVIDAAWRADDVLGWVYEYYNVPDLDALREKARSGGLDPEDVPAANQFYTPHWVVRMLTDNSLGKLFLEHEGTLAETVEAQAEHFETPEARKERSVAEADSVAELCSYLVATGEAGEAPDFDHPSELRVLDPACGSGHFLLYSFDVLERIWWAMTDVPRAEVPAEILRHNLFGVDLDLRACQLAAFNLYLKARSRAEAEGVTDFHLPALGIVCADAHVADLAGTETVFDEVANGNDELRAALEGIVDAFEAVEGLGGLLDVRGTLGGLMQQEAFTLFAENGDQQDLPDVLDNLREAIGEHQAGESFRASDLRSFLRLLVVLSQRYDVALMNPPYGSGYRMPVKLRPYIEKKYRYATEFYVNFYESCNRSTKPKGRIGMLVPRSFMFKMTYQEFRRDLVGGESSLDLLAEFGLGILDNATVRTAGIVVRTHQTDGNSKGDFLRLHDVTGPKKEAAFLESAFRNGESEISRHFIRQLKEFNAIPSAPISYWVPIRLRSIYDSRIVLDTENAGVDGKSLGHAKVGVQTSKDPRFLRYFWEENEGGTPFAKGGGDAWILPRVILTIHWEEQGKEIKRFPNSSPKNEQFFFQEGATYTVAKEGGRRFGYLHDQSIFGHKGSVFFPDQHLWKFISYANSRLFTYLVICQTPERMWEVGEISKLPWDKRLSEKSELGNTSREAAGLLLSLRRHDFHSPYYIAPAFLYLLGRRDSLPTHDEHPHRDLFDRLTTHEPEALPQDASLRDLGIAAAKYRTEVRRRIEAKDRQINDLVYDHFDITDEERDLIETEIALRTNEDPRERPDHDSSAVTEPPEDFPKLVKRMLLHLVFEIVHEDDDGIVLLRRETDDEEAVLPERLEAKFAEVFGEEHAEERLAEADQVLGRRAPQEGTAYPNLHHWLQEKLFAFHCAEFENTPILWPLTSARFSSNASHAPGFACLVDYHRLSAGLFDRLKTRYLEKRKAALHERRAAARQRARDGSLPGEEQEAGRAEEERCASALRQIEKFEEAAQSLSRPQPRDWNDEDRARAEALATKVRRFRERLDERLDDLDALHEEMPRKAFDDRFSPKFMEKVNGKREEWLDALRDLETACEAYAQPASAPVEAHLYDLFEYCPKKIFGSTHYSAGGALFLNYYLSKGQSLADKVEEGREDDLAPAERLIVRLARETDRDAELGKEIAEACKALAKKIPSDWKTRALSEVTTAGYQPVKKHGVAINIEPLDDAEIVPELVKDKVL